MFGLQTAGINITTLGMTYHSFRLAKCTIEVFPENARLRCIIDFSIVSRPLLEHCRVIIR